MANVMTSVANPRMAATAVLDKVGKAFPKFIFTVRESIMSESLMLTGDSTH